MNKTQDFTEGTEKVGKGWSNIMHRTTLNGEPWKKGEVATPFGFVNVYGNSGVILMKFIYNGRFHSRIWKHDFSDRSIATLAKRFAAEKAGKK